LEILYALAQSIVRGLNLKLIQERAHYDQAMKQAKEFYIKVIKSKARGHKS